MGKSTIGPDMQDCAQLLHSTELMNECDISVLISSAGYVGGSSLRVIAVAVSKALVNLEPAWTVGVTRLWPDREERSWEGFLLNLVYEVDSLIEAAERKNAVKTA